MAHQQTRVEHVAEAALALKPAERAAFLEQACESDPDLKHSVEDFLRNAAHPANRPLTPTPEAVETSTGTIFGSPGPGGITGGIYQNGRPRASNDSLSRLAIGDILGDRFLVIRFLANGGMGEVYEVEDLRLDGVHLALKTVLPRIADDPAAQKRFRREVLLAREVAHPHLCPIYDIFHHQHRGQRLTFFTMKLVNGETVTARIKKQGHIDIPEATHVVAQVASALTAIHEAGILHRDIKASNIMLDGTGEKVCATLMDFGLAHTDLTGGESPTTTKLAGTPAYMSPELFRGEPPTKAADIYAFGVVIYQMLTGHLPERDAANELHLTKDSAFHALPSNWQELIRGCLQRETARRYQTISQAAALVAPRSLTSPTRISRRHMLQLSAAASIAAATGIYLDWPNIDQKLEQWTHPLPKKRFVALLDWPTADAKLKPLLSGVLDAIASELQRAEAFDRDLSIIAQKTTTELTTAAQVDAMRESLGANLVLAATGTLRGKELEVLLQVFDPSTNRSLRGTKVKLSTDEQQSLPARAVRAAARLLNITGFEPDDQRTRPATNNPDALAAFQQAEALRKKDNDTGLDEAIENYKKAIDFDPRYAQAQARLAWAYLRTYGINNDPGALSLGRENAEAAILLNRSLGDAHVALAWATHLTGESQVAAEEITTALSIDPSDQHALLYQAYIYTANGKWAEAEGSLTRLIKLHPNYWLAHSQLGWLLDSQGKYTQALVEFRAASLALPSNALVIANIGSIYLETGNLPNAVTSFQKSYQLRPNADASAGMAEVNRILGNYLAAIGFAEDAVKIRPSSGMYWLELGDCHSALSGQKNKSLEAYRRATEVLEDQIHIQRKNGSAWMQLALAQVKSGELSKGAASLLEADSTHADDLYSQIIKVRILELLGRRDLAVVTAASCLTRGATTFQFQALSDIDSLRLDPRYKALMNSTGHK